MSLISKEKKDKAAETKENDAKAAEKKETSTKAVTTKKRAQTPAKVTSNSAYITNEAVVEALSDMDTSVLPTIYASDGTHMANGEDIGKTFKYFPVLQYPLWKVEPGSTDEEAKDFKVSSLDGEVDRDGVSLQETLEECIEAGYSKAKIKEYICIKCMVAEYDDSNIDLDEGFAVFRIAPGSQWGEGGYRSLDKKMKLKAALGKVKTVEVPGLEGEEAVLFSATAEVTKFDGNTFTKSVVTLSE